MKQRSKMVTGIASLVLFLAGAEGVRAQEPDEDAKPKPAARGIPSLPGDTENSQDPGALQPDTRPLTGVQSPTLGKVVSEHSYWIPGIQYGNTIQNQVIGAQQQTGWSVTNYLAGDVKLLRDWKSAELSLNYSGGGTFSTIQGQGNQYFHRLGFEQDFEWSRWQVQFFDQFSYLPESQFGFAGPSTPPVVGGAFQPSDTIYGPGTHYNNAFTTQAVYQLNARSSVNFSGSYGIQRYRQAGNIENNSVTGNAGYNYQLTKKDTIGWSYRFSRYSYVGNPQTIDDHLISVAYGRKITGRVALQLYGGPEITTFGGLVKNPMKNISGAGGASITYQFSKNVLNLTYSRGVSGGSGVFTGSTTDQFQSGINRPLGRAWQTYINFGYARNTTIGGVPAVISGQTYNTWFAGTGVNRPLGANANFSLGYTARIQNSSVSPCLPGNCNVSQTGHQISMTLQWHTRPLVLR